jgi:hypothetical protein
MFSRRWIINYLLIVLIIVFTYVGNRFDVKTGFQQQADITGLEAADIESVEIKTADASLSLRRGSNGWQLEAPIRWPANNINVERMLDIVNSQSDSRLDAAEIDLASLGLDFPKAMLRLNDTRVLFGSTNNIGGRRYTMIDSTVFLLPDNHLPFISQGLTGMVDRRLVPRSLGLARLKLPELEVSRDAGGDWVSTTSDYTSQQAMQLAENWQGLAATRVNAFNPASTPRQKIEAVLEQGERLEFFLMSIEPEIVIANPRIGLQYHFGAEFYYQLIALRRDDNPA